MGRKTGSGKRSRFDYLEMSIDETEEKLARLDQPVDEIKKAIEKTGVPIKSICLSGHRKYPLGHMILRSGNEE